MHTTSLSLLLRLQAGGDEDDWQRLVALYTPLLLHWASKQGLQPSDAADLVQDVLLLLVRKLPEFHYDPKRTFRGWLRTVMLNRLRDLRRRRREVQADDVTDPPAVDSDEFWEVEYRRQLVSRALQIMRAAFAENTWQACWRAVVEEKSAAQVAAELGMSEGAVYVAKSRVLARLRVELAGIWD